MNKINKTWQIRIAKNKFSEMVNLAVSGNPQLVTKNGKPAISAIDGLIAATAIDKDFLRVTRNVDDFRLSGVKLFNPWEY